MIKDKICYIRRTGNPWVCGRSHHEHALQSYQELYIHSIEPGESPKDGHILVPHADGGIFVGYFTQINSVVYQFKDEANNIVDIMFEHPDTVARINRIVDN
jgi:hypothetical protein